MNQSVGERLKAARHNQNLTLSEVQQMTKVQERYLEAIEADMFTLLPSEFYAKVFVRQFAQAVGEDPNMLVDLYLGKPTYEELEKEQVEFIEEQQATDIDPIPIEQTPRATQRKQKRSAVPLIVLGMLAFFILGGVFYITIFANRVAPPITNNNALNVSPPAIDTVEPPQETQTDSEDSTTTETTPTPEPVREPEPFTLEETARTGNTITLKAENVQFPLEIEMTPGANNRVRGRVGNTAPNPAQPDGQGHPSAYTITVTKEQFENQNHFFLLFEVFQNTAQRAFVPMTEQNAQLTINGEPVALGDNLIGAVTFRIEYTTAEVQTNTSASNER